MFDETCCVENDLTAETNSQVGGSNLALGEFIPSVELVDMIEQIFLGGLTFWTVSRS
jgi:hypothetical protein